MILRVAAIWALAGALSGQSAESKINAGDGLKYVRIPPGVFPMGCAAGDRECFDWEQRAKQVRIERGFWIGETLVTQDAYERVMGGNPSRYRGARKPVDQVGWIEAQEYCSRTGMRLPTEAEWEYAARGGGSAARYGAVEEIAWFDGNSGDETHEVASKRANGFGLYDMLGNLWEWVEDSWGTGGAKLLKGGSFFNIARDVRASNRLWAAPDTRHRDMGFRCAGD